MSMDNYEYVNVFQANGLHLRKYKGRWVLFDILRRAKLII